MTSAWPQAALSTLLRQVSRPEVLDPLREYTMLGARWYAGGLFKKEVQTGQSIKAARVYRVQPGDFVYNRLFAWKGSFAVADEVTEGCYVSNEFPCFEVDSSRLEAHYLLYYFMQSASWNKALGLSSGATPTSRNRLKEKQFLEMVIPLPPMDEQRRLVHWIESIARKVEEGNGLTESVDQELGQLLATVRNRISEKAPRKRLADVAPLLRRPVAVDIAETYEQVAVRSFGRGSFHKEPLVGADVTWEKPFRVIEGDILISNIKAWEGAIAVATAEDDGRVASHRYLTLVPTADVATAKFLVAYLLSEEGLFQIGMASPGSADRNRTLSVKKLLQIEVPIPSLSYQKQFDSVVDYVARVRSEMNRALGLKAGLMPTVLNRVFMGEM